MSVGHVSKSPTVVGHLLILIIWALTFDFARAARYASGRSTLIDAAGETVRFLMDGPGPAWADEGRYQRQ